MGKEQIIKKLSILKKFGIAICIAAGTIALVAILYGLGIFGGVSLKFYDALFFMRGEKEARKNIVIIPLDVEFYGTYRKTNAPVSREVMARLLASLNDAGAFLVGFDVIFSIPDWSEGGDDAFEAELIRCEEEELSLVILGGFFDQGSGLQVALDRFPADHGLINVAPDKDGVVRRVYPLFPIAEDIHDPVHSKKMIHGALSTWLTAYYEDITPDQWVMGGAEDDFYFKIGDKTFFEENMLINFTGGRENYTYIPAKEVIEETADLSLLEDAIVLIADTRPTSHDFYPVPYTHWSQRKQADWAGQGIALEKTVMPGVEVHANAIQTLIDNSWIRPVSKAQVMTWLLVIGCVAAIVFFIPKFPNWLAAAFGIIILGGEIGAAHILFSKFYWFDMVPIFAVTLLNFGGGAIYKNLVLASANKKVAGMFGQYVSPNIVHELLAGGEEISMKGRTRDVTVLFSDIRGFTPISEKLTPEQIGVLLNTYFDAMIGIVFQHDGTLDKLMGDAIMAFWGDPVPFDDHPEKACRAALAMMKKLNEMKADPPCEGMEMVNIGIGLNSGIVTVGDLGSFEYRDYTVIGDNVNLGSRVEGMNKPYGTNIIITENTHALVKDTFDVRKLDAVRVKGKTEPVVLYELIGETGKTDEETTKCIRRYEEGLALYMQADFRGAQAIFKECTDTWQDAAAPVFIQRCDDYIEHPPAENWDGVYTAKSK